MQKQVDTPSNVSKAGCSPLLFFATIFQQNDSSEQRCSVFQERNAQKCGGVAGEKHSRGVREKPTYEKGRRFIDLHCSSNSSEVTGVTSVQTLPMFVQLRSNFSRTTQQRRGGGKKRAQRPSRAQSHTTHALTHALTHSLTHRSEPTLTISKLDQETTRDTINANTLRPNNSRSHPSSIPRCRLLQCALQTKRKQTTINHKHSCTRHDTTQGGNKGTTTAPFRPSRKAREPCKQGQSQKFRF